MFELKTDYVGKIIFYKGNKIGKEMYNHIECENNISVIL